MTTSIMLNGKPFSAEPGITITALLHEKSISPAHVVVEVNGAIIAPDTFDTCIMRDHDVVEILRFVGGG